MLVAPAFAVAEAPARPLREPGTAEYFEVVGGPATINDLVFARQVLPPTTDAFVSGAPRVAQSRVLYLNKNGVTLQPGTNDARNNRTTLADQATTIEAWSASTTTWDATVACVRDLFSAYDVTVTETDPGNVPHIEAVFGGRPTQLGMRANIAGVAPFTTNCGIIENAMVFTFTEIMPNDPRMACEVAAQEIAHAFGLDHEMLASDPMTYLNYDGDRTFQDQTAACGEDAARPCGINGTVCRPNQNSVQLLGERLGFKAGEGGSDGGSGNGGPVVNPGSTTTSPEDDTGGCATGGGGSGLVAGLGLLGLVALRSRGLQRRRAHRQAASIPPFPRSRAQGRGPDRQGRHR